MVRTSNFDVARKWDKCFTIHVDKFNLRYNHSLHRICYTHCAPKDLEAEGDNPDENKSDVFLLCKHYMHSTSLTQKPALLLPANRLSRLGPAPTEPLARNSFSERQLQEFRKTARQIALAPWNLIRASNYLVELCDSNEAKRIFEPPELVFLFKVMRH